MANRSVPGNTTAAPKWGISYRRTQRRRAFPSCVPSHTSFPKTASSTERFLFGCFTKSGVFLPWARLTRSWFLANRVDFVIFFKTTCYLPPPAIPCPLRYSLSFYFGLICFRALMEHPFYPVVFLMCKREVSNDFFLFSSTSSTGANLAVLTRRRDSERLMCCLWIFWLPQDRRFGVIAFGGHNVISCIFSSRWCGGVWLRPNNPRQPTSQNSRPQQMAKSQHGTPSTVDLGTGRVGWRTFCTFFNHIFSNGCGMI